MVFVRAQKCKARVSFGSELGQPQLWTSTYFSVPEFGLTGLAIGKTE
jgi:hypothetical protein